MIYKLLISRKIKGSSNFYLSIPFPSRLQVHQEYKLDADPLLNTRKDLINTLFWMMLFVTKKEIII